MDREHRAVPPEWRGKKWDAETGMAALRAKYGAEADVMLQRAKDFIAERYGNRGAFVDFLEETGLADDPAAIAYLAKRGAAAGDLRAQAMALMQDPRYARGNPASLEYRQIEARLAELYRKIAGDALAGLD